MKKKWLISIIIAAVVLISALLFWRNTTTDKGTQWVTALVEKGNVMNDVTATGTLSAINTVTVGTQVSGVISNLYADFNDQVKAGQVLARLDPRLLKAAMEDAGATLEKAKIQLDQAKRNYDNTKQFNASPQSDVSIRDAQANLDKAQVQFDQANRDFERYKDLYAKGVVAKVDFETYQTNYQAAKATLESAQVALDKAKANVSNVDIKKSLGDYQTAQANVTSAKAALERAQTNLDFATITAPISGVIISREVEVGQTVAASFNAPTLFIIAADLTKMQIEASVDEADIGSIRQGQKVSFTVDAYLDKTFEGTVNEIRLQPTVVNNVVTYTVIVDANNEDKTLLPGMTANLTIVTDERDDVVKIPNKALNFHPSADYIQKLKKENPDLFAQMHGTNPNAEKVAQSGNFDPNAVQKKMKERGVGMVWTLKDNELQPHRVKIGLSDGIFTEMKEGDLQPGDAVVTGTATKSESASASTTKSPFVPSRPKR